MSMRSLQLGKTPPIKKCLSLLGVMNDGGGPYHRRVSWWRQVSFGVTILQVGLRDRKCLEGAGGIKGRANSNRSSPGEVTSLEWCFLLTLIVCRMVHFPSGHIQLVSEPSKEVGKGRNNWNIFSHIQPMKACIFTN